MQNIKTGESTPGVMYFKTYEKKYIAEPTPKSKEVKINTAKHLIRLHPFKLSFAAKALFGDESSNSLTKITNRMNDRTVMTETEADKVIAAYKDLAEDILSLTHCDKPTVNNDNL